MQLCEHVQSSKIDLIQIDGFYALIDYY